MVSHHVTRGDHIPMAPPKTWSEHDDNQGGKPRTVGDKVLDSEMQLEELLRHIDAMGNDMPESSAHRYPKDILSHNH